MQDGSIHRAGPQLAHLQYFYFKCSAVARAPYVPISNRYLWHSGQTAIYKRFNCLGRYPVVARRCLASYTPRLAELQVEGGNVGPNIERGFGSHTAI